MSSKTPNTHLNLLKDVLVLDLSRVLAGPWASQTLADLGATVIKIERPGVGDDTRAFGPPFFGEGEQAISAYFMSANRGKHSVTIDLSTDTGCALVKRLASQADILIENYKFGDLARRELDYESLAADNPGLIYCSVTGFGQTGPYRTRPGYDFIIQGLAGLMSITGAPDAEGGTPQKVGVALADIMTGLYSTIAILAALQERNTSGLGQHIDMSLMDVVTACLANQASNYLVSGEVPERLGNAHPNIVPYQAFATREGFMIVAVGNDSQFRAFCEVLGLAHLGSDAMYQTNRLRVKNRQQLIPVLEAVMLTRDMDDWLARFEASNVPASPINTIDRVFSDPQIEARQMQLTLGGLPLVANPMRFSRSQLQYDLPPPVLGAHTLSILGQYLGENEASLANLLKEGVRFQAPEQYMTAKKNKKDSGVESPGEPKAETKPEPVADNLVTTKHSVTIGGKAIRYTAKVGTLVLKEEDDKKGHQPRAEIFFMSFTLDGVKDPAKRPVTFSFNGGPGSSSVWMLLGLLGPKRVPLSKSASERLKPPYKLSDNEFSLLVASDLVFIDPVGTGYSRPLAADDESNPDEFYSFQRDIDSIGEFIRLYTSREQRWASPRFLIGESYGTTRAAALSNHLQERYGMSLNGIMLVSVVLNFQTLLFHPGNDLPNILYLPSYALAARYHGLLNKKFTAMPEAEFTDEVRAFSEGPYNQALMMGDRLAGKARDAMVQQIAAYTGLSTRYVEASNLRIEIMRFARELLRGSGKVIGRFDSRITGLDVDDVRETFERDPSFDVVHGVYAGCLNDFVRRELKFESDLPYEILAFKVMPKWNYDKFTNRYVNTAEMLRMAMMRNPHLKVLVANGKYDMATPFFATEYTFSHLGLRGDAVNNVTHRYYDAGHMMYMDKKSLTDLSRDLKQFVKGAS